MKIVNSNLQTFGKPQTLLQTLMLPVQIMFKNYSPLLLFYPKLIRNVKVNLVPLRIRLDWKQIRSETQCENHAKTHSICVTKKS